MRNYPRELASALYVKEGPEIRDLASGSSPYLLIYQSVATLLVLPVVVFFL